MTKNIIPLIGFGTFGSDRYYSEQVGNAVMFAIKTGFRIFYYARVHGNITESEGYVCKVK